MEIKRKNDNIQYGSLNGQLRRLECPPEKGISRTEQVVTVFVIVACIYVLCLFF